MRTQYVPGPILGPGNKARQHSYSVFLQSSSSPVPASSKVKRGQGEQLQAATSGLCECIGSVNRAELAILYQLFSCTDLAEQHTNSSSEIHKLNG